LKFVQIYFGTATYDKIERDQRVTVQAQLGVIGGTMGLLTGFSILSGLEIVYFSIRFVLSLTIFGYTVESALGTLWRARQKHQVEGGVDGEGGKGGPQNEKTKPVVPEVAPEAPTPTPVPVPEVLLKAAELAPEAIPTVEV
jgi:hypothetical protein